jgi:hypothetical protein
MCFNCDEYNKSCEEQCDECLIDASYKRNEICHVTSNIFCEAPFACAKGFCGDFCDCPDCTFDGQNTVENSTTFGKGLSNMIKRWIEFIFKILTNLHTLLCSFLICLIIYVIYQLSYETSIIFSIRDNVTKYLTI